MQWADAEMGWKISVVIRPSTKEINVSNASYATDYDVCAKDATSIKTDSRNGDKVSILRANGASVIPVSVMRGGCRSTIMPVTYRTAEWLAKIKLRVYQAMDSRADLSVVDIKAE